MTPPTLVDGSAPRSPRQLLDYLEGLGLASQTFEHPPVFTVEEAKALRGSLVGAHTKNLFLRDKKGVMWLVVALEDRALNLNALAESLGHRRFSFGSAARLMSYLGVIPGAVTPFAVINDVTHAVGVALDLGLRQHAVWNFHPLDNGMTTSISGDEMIRFLEAVGHAPRWVDMEASSFRDAPSGQAAE